MVKPWDRKKLGPSITVWNSTEWCVNWIISWAKIWTVLWSTIKISENLFVTTAGFILIYIPLNLPDGRGWLRGKLGLVLMGGAMLSKSLIQFNSDDYIYNCGQECLRRNEVALIVNKSPKCSAWVQSQKQQNDLGSFPRQAIQHHSNPGLFPNH